MVLIQVFGLEVSFKQKNIKGTMYTLYRNERSKTYELSIQV